MMTLLVNMDLLNIEINILAKANYGIVLIFPPAKAGGNSEVIFELEWGIKSFRR